jgi:hypothetical protein
VLFRSLNSRGLPLNELDIIRAELVGSTTYDPSLAEEIADCWDEIQAEIGHDEFLKYVRTVISLIRTSAADADLRDVLRDQEPPLRGLANTSSYMAGEATDTKSGL